MPSAIAKVEKELDKEYKKALPTADLLVGMVIGIFGGFSASLFKDLVIGNNKSLEWIYFIAFGGITFFGIRAIDQRGFRKVYRLEKRLKKLKKKNKT